MNKSIGILVLSCDKYADLWKPFARCFNKYFPEIGWNKYIGSNTIVPEIEGFIPVMSGPDKDWSTSLKVILEQIHEDIIFVILEDIFISNPIGLDILKQLEKFIQANEVNYLRYFANPKPDVIKENSIIGAIGKSAPYRATVCGFWNRLYLSKLLLRGETPWNFEIMGSYRTSYDDGFYSLIHPICTFYNMVEKGRWIRSSINSNFALELGLDRSSRQVTAGVWTIKSLIANSIFNLSTLIHWKLRLKIMNAMRKIFVCY